jgi:hypothetical protein
MSPADLEDLQAEIADLVVQAESIVADLRNAECCESLADFKTNLEEALHSIASLRANVKEVNAGAP